MASMISFKAVTRLASTSSPIRSIPLRYLSTEPTSEAVDSHIAQSKERQRSIRKVSEEGGAHSQLVALAVKNTANRAAQGSGSVSKEQRLAQAKRQLERKKAEHQGGNSGASSTSSSGPRSFTNRNQSRSQAGGGGGGQQSAEAMALLRGNAQQRPFNPRFPAASNDRSPRPPRRNSPSSSSSSASSKPSSKGPKGPRRQQKSSSSSSSSIFSAEDTKPLVPPPQVPYPSINLAQLLRADLAAKTLQVKRSVDSTTKNSELDENSQDPKVREQTRKVLNGDYSQWAEGQNGKKEGEKEALGHAKNLLARNPTIGLEGREVLINKLKEVL
ncbi:uncharacterized protein JCM6883_001779 [Sporobolomyces salmoneus]|uniref:uncharacterized protein n=1 Tax=Sporobolomyces salmoneus TaxID=183962 RepID=UPI0031738CCC